MTRDERQRERFDGLDDNEALTEHNAPVTASSYVEVEFRKQLGEAIVISNSR
jgi:hypothetical protein